MFIQNLLQWLFTPNKKGLHRCKPLIYMVELSGIEPLTSTLPETNQDQGKTFSLVYSIT